MTNYPPENAPPDDLARANLRALMEAAPRPPLPDLPEPEAQEAPPAEIPEAEAIIYRYRVSVVLTPALEMRVNAARQSGGMPAAEVGVFALAPDFHTNSSDGLVSAVKTWAHGHLPLTLVIERVDAETVDENRYRAGMALEPAERLKEVQASLNAVLQPLIISLASVDFAFAPRLPVSDYTPANSFPKVIHALQAEFESREWTISAVEVLRAPEGDLRWEVVEKIGA